MDNLPSAKALKTIFLTAAAGTTALTLATAIAFGLSQGPDVLLSSSYWGGFIGTAAMNMAIFTLAALAPFGLAGMAQAIDETYTEQGRANADPFMAICAWGMPIAVAVGILTGPLYTAASLAFDDGYRNEKIETWIDIEQDTNQAIRSFEDQHPSPFRFAVARL